MNPFKSKPDVFKKPAPVVEKPPEAPPEAPPVVAAPEVKKPLCAIHAWHLDTRDTRQQYCGQCGVLRWPVHGEPSPHDCPEK